MLTPRRYLWTAQLKHFMPGTYQNWSPIAYAIKSLEEKWLSRTGGNAGGGGFPES